MIARSTAAAAALACAALMQPAIAQDAKGAALDPAKAGIAIYPGASADAAVASLLRESMQLTAAAYRTGDSADKVSAFYARQAGMSRMAGDTKEQSAFLAGCKEEFNKYMKKNMQKCDYHVTIQNPWMDMKTGKMVRDTLISIVKQ